MKTKTTFAVAVASLLALGGSAMAASHHSMARSHWSAARQQEFYGARAQAPLGGTLAAPDFLRGRSDVSASQPGFNPSLDRAKGGL